MWLLIRLVKFRNLGLHPLHQFNFADGSAAPFKELTLEISLNYFQLIISRTNSCNLFLGLSGALSLVINTQAGEYANAIKNDLISQGAVLIVSNEPETFSVNDPVNLENGKSAFVAISAASSYFTPPSFPVWSYPCATNAKLRYIPGKSNLRSLRYFKLV